MKPEMPTPPAGMRWNIVPYGTRVLVCLEVKRWWGWSTVLEERCRPENTQIESVARAFLAHIREMNKAAEVSGIYE